MDGPVCIGGGNRWAGASYAFDIPGGRARISAGIRRFDHGPELARWRQSNVAGSLYPTEVRRSPESLLEVSLVRIRRKALATAPIVLPAALLAIGLVVGRLQSTEWSWRNVLLDEVSSITALDPVRALPRTAAALATLDAQHQLESNRPYAAWLTLRDHLDVDGPIGAMANLIAARAAAEWEGWQEVRSVLADRSWLADVDAGEGLLLLARAEEALGDVDTAIASYRAYLAVEGAREPGIARARLAGLLADTGAMDVAAEAYGAAAIELPTVADWMRVRQAEVLLEADDPTVLDVFESGPLGSPVARSRLTLLEARVLEASAEPGRAIDRLEWEARTLRAGEAWSEAAQLDIERGRLLIESGNALLGRELLRSVAADSRVAGSVRVGAADRLGELDERTGAEELARADAYGAMSRAGAAADALEAAFDQGVPRTHELTLRLAENHYESRNYIAALPEYQRAAELAPDVEGRAYAELYAARSLFRGAGSGRGGQAARRDALAAFERIAKNYPESAAAGTALFLLGDEARTTREGLAYYRRAAAIEHSPDAREALFRVGHRSLRLDDRAGAIRAWEEYVGRYPAGDETARIAYDVAKLNEAAGRRTEARAMYQAAVKAEPTSYWALRAAERVSTSPLGQVLKEIRPIVGLATEPGEAAAILARMDLLSSAGLESARQAEYEAAVRRFEQKPLALVVLAEGMRDRGYTVEGIQLGRRLLAMNDGQWNGRILRLVYPFPYRDVIVEESRRAGIDPMLYAGLVRQESTFRPRIKSRVGATGLGQIMPATGRWLAPSVGIRNYDDSLLEIPEVNVRMGAKYLADLLTRYNGAADLALAGYNAGPGRADRWRRQFNYGRDTDAFRAAIPFDETRNYVMIVLRNAAVYEGLYGGTIGS